MRRSLRRGTIPALVGVLAVAAATTLTAGFGQPPPAGRALVPAAAATALAPVNDRELELSADEAANVRVYELANRSVVNITTRGGSDDVFLFAPPRQGS